MDQPPHLATGRVQKGLHIPSFEHPQACRKHFGLFQLTL